MENNDTDVSDFFRPLNIQPYQFEPLVESDEGSGAENSDIPVDSDIEDDGQDRLVNTDWCECGNCDSMETVEECVCCAHISAVNVIKESEDLNCITEHTVFIRNCLDRHVLQICMYEYAENVAPFDDNEPINERYRYLAYRRFVQWIWQRLGRNNRKILPSCVVLAIRKAFPSEQYCGFKYADL